MSILDDLVDAVANRVLGRSDTAVSGSRLPNLTPKGFKMTHGGFASWVEPPSEFSATSAQTAGMWPFCVGTSSALIGAPLGRNIYNGSVVCCDPMSLFIRGIISAPSAMIIALNGRGKSSLIVRMCLFLADLGYIPMVLSDLKPDYVGMVQHLGGRVIQVGPGFGSVNPLDSGPLRDRFHELPRELQKELAAEIQTRRVSTVRGLLELTRGRPLDVDSQEPVVLSMAVREAAAVAEDEGREPVIQDLIDVIQSAPKSMQALTLSDNEEAFRLETKSLVKGLIGLLEDGPFGNTFSRETTVEMPVDKAVCFDVSAVDISDSMMRAAIQTVCWAYGQSAASAAKTLGEAGLAPERHHFMVMDEMWQILEASELLVHQINAVTRLNRTKGLGQILCTHSMKDLTLSTDKLSKIARGFMERSSVKIFGGLARNEMPLLEEVMPLSEREKQLLVEWSAEGATDPRTGKTLPPPGRGRFMIKLGENVAGEPLSLNLTATEKRIHDTNSAWAAAMAGVAR